MNIRNFLIFSALVLFLYGCGSDKVDPVENGRTLFGDAMQQLDSNRVLEAVTLLEKIINQYPSDSLFPTALYTAAGLYQSMVVPVPHRDTAIHRSIRYFNLYYSGFPDSSRAEQALFALGYLYANETKQFELGKAKYEEYLKRFPTGRMAEAARQELQIIGKSPDEVLKNVR